MKQRFFYYFFNYLNRKHPYWCAPCILRYKDFTCAETLRIDGHINGKYPVLEDGGWHFSYLGGAEKIIEKIESFSHQEFSKSKFKDRDTITRLISSGKDLFGRKGYTYKVVSIDRNFPEYVVSHKEKYRSYIAPCSIMSRFLETITAPFH